MARLTIPHKDYAESYATSLENGLNSSAGSGDSGLPESSELYLLRHNFQQWFDNQFDLSIPVKTNMGDGERLPHSLFWLVEDSTFIGSISVRHHLDDFLKMYGGHIGYRVTPEMRGKGYGHLMMTLIQPHLHDIGLSQYLIIIDENNRPSIRVAEKAGAIYTDKIELPWQTGTYRHRYWLNI